MEPWVWAIIGVVPVVAAGIAYSMGAFSTNTPAINQQIDELDRQSREFRGDSIGGRRMKTKKSKSKHRKTKRHSK